MGGLVDTMVFGLKHSRHMRHYPETATSGLLTRGQRTFANLVLKGISTLPYPNGGLAVPISPKL